MNELTYLLSTAIFIGTVHTLIGVDHYVPFIVLSKANNWSIKKTSGIVFICGLGHVLSSLMLGFVGLAISSSLSSLVGIEDIRGTLATYFIIAFGLGYTAYALFNLYKNRSHMHAINGHEITHNHHDAQSVEDHISDKKKANIPPITIAAITRIMAKDAPSFSVTGKMRFHVRNIKITG